jgi:acetyl-CoA C-acetyltransferase
MARRAAVLGIGFTPLRASSSYQSFKEMMFEAAQRAYADAGISPAEVDSFVTCAEDFSSGVSIFDEYTPDQLGAVQKPMHTLTQDGLHGLADGAMQILSGVAELVVVEAHSKASNVEAPGRLLEYALDPIYNRPLGFNPHAIAALEMNLLLHESGLDEAACDRVVAENCAHALANPLAAYASRLAPEDVACSPYLFYPLRERHIARAADGCVVIVLGSEAKARGARSAPVWISGVGFANDSPTLESRDWLNAEPVRAAARIAYAQAGIRDPRSEIDLFEVDDSYAYKELQHLAALGLYRTPGEAAEALERGEGRLDGPNPVNPSGGSLGMGQALEASGLYRIVELVLQLRGQAGARQRAGARRGLAQSWRGVPTTSAAVAVLSRD